MPGLQAEETLRTTPLEQLGSPDDRFEQVYRLALAAWGDRDLADNWRTTRLRMEYERRGREA